MSSFTLPDPTIDLAAMAAKPREPFSALIARQTARDTECDVSCGEAIDTVRYRVDDGEIVITAYKHRDKWLMPEDTFLPAVIECWQAEIAAIVAQQDADYRDANSEVNEWRRRNAA